MSQELLKSYIQEALVAELKFRKNKRKKRYGKKESLFKKFLEKLKSSLVGDEKDKEEGLFDKLFSSSQKKEIKDLIEDWVDDIENFEGRRLDRRAKEALEGYAEKVYSRMIDRYSGNNYKASEMTRRALDMQYAQLRSRTSSRSDW